MSTVNTASDPVEDLLQRLHRVRRTPSGWGAQCPAHEDNKNSLVIARGDDDKALLKCQAGCETSDILLNLGLTMQDLFPKAQSSTGRIVAEYDYCDEEGRLLFQAVRKEPKDFRQRHPSTNGNEWEWNLNGTRRVLYKLPQLLAADPKRTVFIVEGEKDVDRLIELGFIATTNPQGAGKWRDDYSPTLEGRKVLIIPDNDDPGMRHAGQVTLSLAPYVSSLKVLVLPDLPPKGDVSDWLDAGSTVQDLKRLAVAAAELPVDNAELLRKELLHLLREGSLQETSPGTNQPPPEDAFATNVRQASPEIRWLPRPISELSSGQEQLDWIWHGYAAPGMITLFTGLWKSGKSTLLAYLLQSLDGTLQEFAGQPVRAAKALVISEEGERHWVDRRDNLGIEDHVSIITKPFLKNPSWTDWERFVATVAIEAVQGKYGLVVFDSIFNLWPVKDENNAAEVKAALMSMNQLTEAALAVLLIAHPKKGDAGEGQATRGSGALPSIVDIIIEFRRYDAERREDTRRVLTTYSRFDDTPPEVVIEYDAADGYTARGTRQDARAAGRKAVILELLPDDEPGVTVEDILETWPDDHQKPARRTLAYDLDFLATNMEVIRKGAGKRNDAYRYRRSHTDISFLASSLPYRGATNETNDEDEDAEIPF